MSTDIKTEVERYAESALQQARWLADTMALEVYGTKEVGPYRDSMTAVTVITGIGGPHVEFTVDPNDRVTGSAYWGSDSAKAYDNVPDLFEALLPLVGGEE